MRKSIFVLFLVNLFFTSPNGRGSENFYLHAGPAVGATYLRTLDETETQPGMGILSHAGYKWKSWSIGISSFFLIHHYHRLHFRVWESDIRSKGYLRRFTIAPSFKYQFNNSSAPSSFFTRFGPLYGLDYFVLRSPQVQGGNFKQEYELTVEGKGGFLSMGWEDFKNQLYYEILYSYLKGEKASVITGDLRKIETLGQEKMRRPLEVHSLVFSIGFFIF